MIERREFLIAGLVAASSSAFAADRLGRNDAKFPTGFLWGAATAGHQVEGNNVNSDLWLLENIKPTVFAEPSGDAVNSLMLWRQDMDLVKSLGLNSYRFSIEWARIEPEPGQFSMAMLDHYKAMIDGCRERGLTPLVTFNHFVAPRWFAALGGWLNPEAPNLFARYCERAARRLASGIGYAITFNEPNLLRLLRIAGLPAPVLDLQREMLATAARVVRSERYNTLNVANWEDIDRMLPLVIAGHKAARQAIKSVRADLPVGVSLAMFDDQAVGAGSLRDAKRQENYGAWLEAAREDDFLGVQNYERVMWGAEGKLPAPQGATLNWSGAEVHAPSLAGAVRYAYQATGVPILVSEHGVGTDDDAIRAGFIPAALSSLKQVMDEGVPVRGYCHWSLLDNFEWIFGYKPRYGLVAVDRSTFMRTPKPSASVLGAIARRNSL